MRVFEVPSAPVDPFSGLTYHIAPREIIAPEDATDHHLLHAADDPVHSTVGGAALRENHVELTHADDHNRGPRCYHERVGQPVLLTDEGEQLGAAGLLGGKYISKVLDLNPDIPEVREPARKELALLRRPGKWVSPKLQSVAGFGERFFPGAPIDTVRPHFHQFKFELTPLYLPHGNVLMHQFVSSLILPRAVELDGIACLRSQFRVTHDPELARRIFTAAAYDLAETTMSIGQTVAEQYREARKDGRLHPDAPPEVAEIFVLKLGKNFAFESVVQRLTDRLDGREDSTDLLTVSLADSSRAA